MSVKLYLGHRHPNMPPVKTTLASDKLIEDINRGIISGIISLAGFSTDEWRKPLSNSNLPLVSTDSVFPNGIDFDMDDLIRKSIDILLGKGCKAPWIITNNESHFNIFTSIMKGKGISLALERLVSKSLPGYLPKNFGYASVMETFAPSAKNKPDGLLFADDTIFKDAVMGCSLDLNFKS